MSTDCVRACIRISACVCVVCVCGVCVWYVRVVCVCVCVTELWWFCLNHYFNCSIVFMFTINSYYSSKWHWCWQKPFGLLVQQTVCIWPVPYRTVLWLHPLRIALHDMMMMLKQKMHIAVWRSYAAFMTPFLPLYSALPYTYVHLLLSASISNSLTQCEERRPTRCNN